MLAAVFAVLQVVTYRSAYYASYGFGSRPQQVFLSAQSGSLCAGWEQLYVDNAGWQAYPIALRPVPGGRGGFAWSRYPTNLFAAVPFWFLASVAAGGSWLIRRRGTPPDPNRCRACGYDLRATPGRCPECGTPAGPAADAAAAGAAASRPLTSAPRATA